MKFDIRYEDSEEKIISITEKDSLSHFYKTYLHNGKPKKKEYFSNGELNSIIFYQEAESLDKILNAHSVVDHIEVRTPKQIGVYIYETCKSYFNL